MQGVDFVKYLSGLCQFNVGISYPDGPPTQRIGVHDPRNKRRTRRSIETHGRDINPRKSIEINNYRPISIVRSIIVGSDFGILMLVLPLNVTFED